MKNEYYRGPAGIFYQPKNDSIFILERSFGKIFDRQKNAVVGQIYDFENGERIIHDVGVTGMDAAIMLEEFK